MHIVRTEGAQALFKGLTPTLLQIAPQTGLQFAFYSVCTRLWKAAVSRTNSHQTGNYIHLNQLKRHLVLFSRWKESQISAHVNTGL